MKLAKNEGQIIKKAIEGDEQSFKILFEAYQRPIYNFIFRMLGSQEEAADTTQEVFFKVYKRLSSLRNPDFFSTWLFSIAKNEAITSTRRRKSKNHSSLSDIDERMLRPLREPDHSYEPDEQVLNKEFEAIFQKALLEIPEIYRVAFVLGVLENQPYEQVAKVLGCSVGNIKSRVFRARAHLAKKLKKEYAMSVVS
ncbi:MAG: sigma-70 family RNA polymerase sigma factor [Calditrichaeota bacterium]|nr:sigma-70 family RNA polymerase sigma factor [Calditrichota bacterium]